VRQSTTTYAILALTILIWGNSFAVVQFAIDDGATPTRHLEPIVTMVFAWILLGCGMGQEVALSSVPVTVRITFISRQ
jgi:hypothetical protein